MLKLHREADCEDVPSSAAPETRGRAEHGGLTEAACELVRSGAALNQIRDMLKDLTSAVRQFEARRRIPLHALAVLQEQIDSTLDLAEPLAQSASLHDVFVEADPLQGPPSATDSRSVRIAPGTSTPPDSRSPIPASKRPHPPNAILPELRADGACSVERSPLAEIRRRIDAEVAKIEQRSRQIAEFLTEKARPQDYDLAVAKENAAATTAGQIDPAFAFEVGQINRADILLNACPPQPPKPPSSRRRPSNVRLRLAPSQKRN